MGRYLLLFIFSCSPTTCVFSNFWKKPYWLHSLRSSRFELGTIFLLANCANHRTTKQPWQLVLMRIWSKSFFFVPRSHFVSFHHKQRWLWLQSGGLPLCVQHLPVAPNIISSRSGVRPSLPKSAPCVRGMCAGQRLWLVALVKLERNDHAFLLYLRNAGVRTEGWLRRTQNMSERKFLSIKSLAAVLLSM